MFFIFHILKFYDVMKNADIESDFTRFEKHLNENF